jgi:hypothetical protein
MSTMTAAVYSGIAIYRIEAQSFHVWMNPQPFPHPDALIRWLNERYERQFPDPAPTGVKLHGELPRVSFTFLCVFVPAALTSLILLTLVLAPWIFASKSR